MNFSKIAIAAVLSAVATDPVRGNCHGICFDMCHRIKPNGNEAANGDPSRVCADERIYVQCLMNCLAGCPGFNCFDGVQPFLSTAHGCQFTATQFCVLP